MQLLPRVPGLALQASHIGAQALNSQWPKTRSVVSLLQMNFILIILGSFRKMFFFFFF